MKQTKEIIITIFTTTLYVIAGCMLLITCYVLVVTHCICKFHTPTDSMWPTMKSGTQGIINKLNTHVKQNDIFMFNYPYDWDGDSIRRNMSLFYIKRCVAGPGDTLTIKGGRYYANGNPSEMSKKSLDLLRQTVGRWKTEYNDSLEKCPSFGTIPRDSIFHVAHKWNILNFGPIIVPKKGWKIALDKETISLYSLYINWETGTKWKWNDSIKVAANEEGETMRYYSFRKDYCFAAGDNVANSHDSRYFGFVPCDFIIGTVAIYWPQK